MLVVMALGLLLLATRLALPRAAVRIINHNLGGLEGYTGGVGSSDLRVAGGGFALHEIVFARSGEGDGALRMEADRIDVSFSWIQLARGRISAEIVVTRPRVEFAAGPGRAEPKGPARDPREVLAELRRFEITRLEIVDGKAALEWPVGGEGRTQVLALAEVNARFTNVRNDPAKREVPDATAKIEARFANGGVFKAEAGGAPLASPPFVHASGEIDDLDLTLINPMLMEALGADVSEGTLEIEAEFRAAEGYYEGHVKPFISDARFTRPGEDTSVLEAFWNAVAGVLSNDDTERVATRVPFSGRFGDGKVDGWSAFTTLLGNAFGEALSAGQLEDR